MQYSWRRNDALHNSMTKLCSAFFKCFKNMSQLFIKFTHSFVAIELLNFCKNAKKYFIAQESSQYSVRKQDWFFSFLTFRQKIGFCKWMKITMTAVIEKQSSQFYIQKKAQQIAKRFYTQKATHFSKSSTISVKFLYTESYIFHVTGSSWKFWSWHLYTKSMTLCFKWRFYI